MILCIPTKTNEGQTAAVYEHFGSAPFFTLVDTASGAVEIIDNSNQHHTHGMCQPMSALEGKAINAVICKGMGARAVQRLNEGGIKAYLAAFATVQEIVHSYQRSQLPEITPVNACNQHHCH